MDSLWNFAHLMPPLYKSTPCESQSERSTNCHLQKPLDDPPFSDFQLQHHGQFMKHKLK